MTNEDDVQIQYIEFKQNKNAFISLYFYLYIKKNAKKICVL